MVESKSKEIIQAESLIREGKTAEALEIVRKYEQTAWTYYFRIDYDRAFDIAFQSNSLIEKIGKKSDLANNYFLLGHIYLFKGEYKTSLNYGMKCKDIREKLGDRAAYASSLWLLGLINWLSGNYKNAIEYSKRSLSINEIMPGIKANNLNLLANLHLWQGYFPQSLKYVEEGIQIAEEIELKPVLAQLLYLKAMLIALMNDLTKGKEYCMKSLELSVTPDVIFYRAWALLGIIFVLTEENNMDEAEKYMAMLEKLVDETNSKSIFRIYSVTKGVTLFRSSRTRDRAEAERLFKEVIDEGVHHGPNQVSYMYALYSLILFYIEELKLSNDSKIVEDITPLISFIYKKAEELDSILFLIEGKIFEAKVDIITGNIDSARKLLTEAQELAESSQANFFAQMISEEHDYLLELQDQEKLETLQNTKLESINLASLKGRLSITQRDNSESTLDLKPEIPVLLLIIAEGGILLFSYPFTDEWKHDTEIFGSFLSAFSTFSDEFFSKGLDRVKFGEDTLLMQSIDNYSIGYLYKGQTYPAKQKLTTFVNQIKETTMIWRNLEDFYKTSRVAEVKDLPQIENLIQEIFVA